MDNGCRQSFKLSIWLPAVATVFLASQPLQSKKLNNGDRQCGSKCRFLLLSFDVSAVLCTASKNVRDPLDKR